jgi:hypothetical protein
MLTPELETLDQLLTGDLPLAIIRKIYPDDQAFMRGVFALLRCGDVRLLSRDKDDIPEWQWRELFDEGTALDRLDELSLHITERGAQRIS